MLKFKTTAIAATMALALGASSAMAAVPNTWTVGGKLSYVLPDLDSPLLEDEGNGWGLGAYIDYNILSWLGIGFGYNYHDGMDASHNSDPGGNAGDADYYGHLPEIALRLAYPIGNDGTDVYFRGGVAWAFTKWEGPGYEKDSDGIAPFFGIGVQVAFNRNWGVRIGWDHYMDTWDEDIRYKNSGYGTTVDEDVIYVGIQYTFGPGITQSPITVAQPTQVTHGETTLTFGAETLFAFNSAELSDSGRQAIASEVARIQEHNVQNLGFEVSGYTDRIGSPEYNQRLSESRANAVANALIENGIPESTITSVAGYGSTNSVTGDKCNDLGRQDLISCLAPDRRVEVRVSGDIVQPASSTSTGTAY